jgi:hypothetical protein
MREKKFTPGPWEQNQPQSGTIYIDARLRGTTLQEVCSCGPTETLEQRQANGHLIAAAPELLEALEEAIDLVNGILSGDYDPDTFTVQPWDTAVSKAYGDTP